MGAGPPLPAAMEETNLLNRIFRVASFRGHKNRNKRICAGMAKMVMEWTAHVALPQDRTARHTACHQYETLGAVQHKP
jgi:hypothetical protein